VAVPIPPEGRFSSLGPAFGKMVGKNWYMVCDIVENTVDGKGEI
jgi:hypothetical protein